MCRAAMKSFADTARKTLYERLQKRLWENAQRLCQEDAGDDMKTLLRFGWSDDAVRACVEDLAISLSKELLESLPEHVS